MDYFAQNLQALMDAENYNNAELARKLSVHPTTITNWLTGETQPYPKHLAKIGEIFGYVPQSLKTSEPIRTDSKAIISGDKSPTRSDRMLVTVGDDKLPLNLELVRKLIDAALKEKENSTMVAEFSEEDLEILKLYQQAPDALKIAAKAVLKSASPADESQNQN